MALLAWYDQAKRDLPWRHTRDPYAIWVSEIMLQQTQVATVIPFWHRWMATFPTVDALASADEQAVLGLWQGLGYYRRGRLLLEGARFVAQSGMPSGAAEWAKVPGVGRYTAGAISSIAQGEASPLVDGNVERVYARTQGDAHVGPALTKGAWDWAAAVLPADRPGDWNQALMELGATVCRPVNPECDRCPIQAGCVAYREGTVDQLPTKARKPAPVALTHTVWIPRFGELYGVRQIPAGAWWHGMWEFPRADGTDVAGLRELVGPGLVRPIGTLRHAVTHHRITMLVSAVACDTDSSSLAWHRLAELEEIPMPAPQRKALRLALGDRQRPLFDL